MFPLMLQRAEKLQKASNLFFAAFWARQASPPGPGTELSMPLWGDPVGHGK